MRYPGGKGKCFQQLINLMPPHETYIETHLGGGAVLRNKTVASQNIGIDLDPAVIRTWRTNFSYLCTLVEGDAVAYLRNYQFIGNELVYSDPPYPVSTRRRKRIYDYDYVDEDHLELLTTLKDLKCMVMVSSYENDIYNDLLSDWRKVTFTAKTHSGVREECVWLNFPPPSQLHDSRYMGISFRERQVIKRRQERLRSRIARMEAIERNELIRWVSETYKINMGARDAANSTIPQEYNN